MTLANQSNRSRMMTAIVISSLLTITSSFSHLAVKAVNPLGQGSRIKTHESQFVLHSSTLFDDESIFEDETSDIMEVNKQPVHYTIDDNMWRDMPMAYYEKQVKLDTEILESLPPLELINGRIAMVLATMFLGAEILTGKSLAELILPMLGTQ
eukprot:CAMPEP_0172486468 /NCGR_PEP_ID=MMETSP1066-20121228/15047_1 /TAXON_ID=671091 /ORGANISM="Coscinodiscus wailesii, Strain CCMP2513" /LENGTH=152 /DNA_ID=CAMNT_0013252439 /DNA_START=128 /DNA_END=586 /DNA_ORIENTATION=+